MEVVTDMHILCPACKNITTWEENPLRPFCSERCKLIDLAAWASDEYRIPAQSVPEDGLPRQEEDE